PPVRAHDLAAPHLEPRRAAVPPRGDRRLHRDAPHHRAARRRARRAEPALLRPPARAPGGRSGRDRHARGRARGAARRGAGRRHRRLDGRLVRSARGAQPVPGRRRPRRARVVTLKRVDANQRRTRRHAACSGSASPPRTHGGSLTRSTVSACMRPLAALLLALLAARPAGALPLISEVFYDAVGSDDGLSFVEIHGKPGTVLDGWVLEHVNGANGEVAATLALVGVIGPSSLYVVADRFADGTTAVPFADLLLNFDLQNGPDSLVLRSPDGVVDAVGWGEFGPTEFFAGEGSPTIDPPAGSSIARHFANLDSDDNA